ncbi:MAG TPA: phosphotransferase [Gemmataceae bacterium]|nr:phosphotransferase [Gemmataceae bacterium]
MTAGDTRATDAEESGLRHVLERLLGRARGARIQVAGLRRKPSPFATLSAAEVLTVALADGGEDAVFVKHLGPAGADEPDKERRDREVRVYEDLLGRAELPAVRYYGSRWNGATERHEIYLEYVADWNLQYHHLEHWFTAAQRLAQFHGHFAARAGELAARDYLLRLDAAYFRAWAGRALATVAAQSAGLAAELAPVVDHYDPAADLLARQPATLVHNDLAPKNVLALRSSRPARICFIDWEMAGVGCGLLDLVHLKHGLGPADDERMCAAYTAELVGAGLLPTGAAEWDRLVAACELHQTLYRLAYSRSWGLSPATVAGWVREARQFLDRV